MCKSLLQGRVRQVYYANLSFMQDLSIIFYDGIIYVTKLFEIRRGLDKW